VAKGGLQVTSGGAVSQAAGRTITVAGLADVISTGADANGNITLDQANNFGSLKLTSANGSQVTANEASATALADVNVAKGGLQVTSGGAVSQAAGRTITVAGLADVTSTGADANGNITLDQANNFGSLKLTSANGNQVTVNEASATTLNGVEVDRGGLAVNSAGTIDQSGPVTVTADSVLTTSSAGSNVLLDSQANSFGTVTIGGPVQDLSLRNIANPAAFPTIPGGLRNLTLVLDNSGMNTPAIAVTGDLSLRAGGAVNLGDTAVAGNLMVRSAGTVAQSGGVRVGGLASFQTSKDGGAEINLDRANNTVNNSFGSVQAQIRNGADSQDANADITISENDLNGTVLAGMRTKRALAVDSSGPITQTGDLVVGQDAVFRTFNDVGAEIRLDRANDTRNNSFGSIWAESRNAANSADAEAQITLHENAAKGTRLAGLFTEGNVEIVSAGPINQAGPLIANGTGKTLSLNASGNDITLDNAANDFSTVEVVSGQNVTLADANGLDLGTSAVQGIFKIEAAGDITQSGPVFARQNLNTRSAGGVVYLVNNFNEINNSFVDYTSGVLAVAFDYSIFDRLTGNTYRPQGGLIQLVNEKLFTMLAPEVKPPESKPIEGEIIQGGQVIPGVLTRSSEVNSEKDQIK